MSAFVNDCCTSQITAMAKVVQILTFGYGADLAVATARRPISLLTATFVELMGILVHCIESALRTVGIEVY